MVTIKDIAAATGVSATTVSNVINGKSGRVSEKTIKKINDAIEQLGYIPNMSARTLVSNSSKVIGFVNHIVTDKNSNFMEDPFLSKFIGILEQVLRENGYYLMLRTVETPEQFNAFLRTWHLDGLFLSGIFKDDFYNAISPISLPTVLVDSYVRQDGICNVGIDDFSGSNASTTYLINNGHKRIAYASLHIQQEGGVLMERFLGYKSALTENSIPFDPTLVFECGMDLKNTEALADYILEHRNITAIVTTADYLAANIMVNLRKRGIRIPEDVSIMGFDDLNICSLVSPALSTVHQNMESKGIAAVDYMLQLLNGEKPDNPEYIIKPYIVERDSVRSLK